MVSQADFQADYICMVCNDMSDIYLRLTLIQCLYFILVFAKVCDEEEDSCLTMLSQVFADYLEILSDIYALNVRNLRTV